MKKELQDMIAENICPECRQGYRECYCQAKFTTVIKPGEIVTVGDDIMITRKGRSITISAPAGVLIEKS